jgi:hypothetical protein
MATAGGRVGLRRPLKTSIAYPLKNKFVSA